jgi:hypothetical protein
MTSEAATAAISPNVGDVFMIGPPLSSNAMTFSSRRVQMWCHGEQNGKLRRAQKPQELSLSLVPPG